MTFKFLLISIFIFSQPLFSQESNKESVVRPTTKSIILTPETSTQRYVLTINTEQITQVLSSKPNTHPVDSVSYLQTKNEPNFARPLTLWNVYTLEIGLVPAEETPTMDIVCDLLINVYDNLLGLTNCRDNNGDLIPLLGYARSTFEELSIKKHIDRLSAPH